FMGTLWNTYAFYVLYANIDKFDPTQYKLEYDKLSVMDKWLLSKLNTMVKSVDEALGSYKIPDATKALADFVDDMSNWYVRRGRERYWAKDMPQDKINAYMTLYEALVTLCKTAAPMIPFMTEDIYQNLVTRFDKTAPISIHLCDFPVANEAYIDADLEASMDQVLKIVVFGRAARNTANIKSRQPMGNMFVKAAKTLDEYFVEIIEDELNIKAVTFKDDLSDFTSYSFKPQLRTVGPKYGKQLGGIREYLANVDDNEAMATLKAEGALKFDVAGTEVVLAEEDLLIETAKMEGYVTEGDNYVTVVIDTTLTPELIEEGFVREIISKVQTMRKDADFNVTDRIKVYVEGNDKIAEIINANADEIKEVVLANEFVMGAVGGVSKDWNINGEKVVLGVEVI
ncbi:MAG: class I tRNA ligase family protein, partial [Lachnospiraceae bacterium]|nr:class I tRNA ligase family protein [Lachnospiraceae bacterium]